MAVLRHRRGLWGSDLMSRRGPSKAGELGACLLRYQAFQKPPPCRRLLKGLVHQRTGTQLPCDRKAKDLIMHWASSVYIRVWGTLWDPESSPCPPVSTSKSHETQTPPAPPLLGEIQTQPAPPVAQQQHGQPASMHALGAWAPDLCAPLYQCSGQLGIWEPGCKGGQGSGKYRGIQSEKETMQCLNDHLASYLERVRNLEADNQGLESKIWEHLEKKGSRFQWFFFVNKTIEDPRAQIFASSVDNACIILWIDNAHLAADDFRVKYETELAMYQPVESDTNGLRKVIDNISATQLQLETEIEALKEQLLFMKNHEDKIMADIWAQDDALAQKNREELDKYWSQ
ncbi:hypothetical protein QTO34_017214 [Cnephaeus nilssonii]|uniref:IF rod domain-containing protein n=1 Tax=Cnephaeus nilssonii TaxID=3371016 RepID=A0AA40I1F1_CNENI|nr:hypothetical protein QTO34_017214 [Eptesicus nilssonii]